MILKDKLYKFNQQTLQYENKIVPISVIIGKFLRFLGRASLLAFLLSGLFYIFYGSPVDNILEFKANSVKNNFVSLNSDIDSLQRQLHSQYFYNDQYYREVLELDSVPDQVRLAGIGGSEPKQNIEGYFYNDIISSTSKRIKTINKQIEIQDNSYRNILKEALIYNNELTTIPAIQPVKPSNSIWISSYFGYRNDPFTNRRKYHKGIDFVGHPNTEIYATADGIITLSKDSRRGYGKEIIISHNFGYSTRYGHLNKILVEEGQKVKRGQLIGLMGSTGRSTGTHLHYEVRMNRRQIDPIYFYADDLTVKEYEMIIELSSIDKN